MFDRIFGNYLVETGVISEEQLQCAYQLQDSSRSRLGLIAVSEKMMTISQVEEVNKLQAVMDKRFGDIAISNGYLTQAQVEHLLKLQGNLFLVFEQALLDKGFATIDAISSALDLYQKENGYTQTDMDDLKSCDLDRVVPFYATLRDSLLHELACTFVRLVARLIDYHVYIDRVYVVDEYKAKCLSVQEQKGDHSIFAGISGSSEDMFKIAIAYAGEKLISDNEDALDAMCEFDNCVNGMFATELSKGQVDQDMEPPEYYSSEVTLKGKGMYILPIHVCGIQFDYILAIDSKVTME